MSTYQTLVDDARTAAGVSKAQASDKALARQLWRKCVTFVQEIAELGGEDARMPRTSASVSIPADLTTGITLPTVANMVKLIGVELTYSNNVKRWVNIVAPSARNALVGRTPAAFVNGATLDPMPSDSSAVWTHDNILIAGWSDISSAAAEYYTYPTEVAAMTDTFPLDAVFEDPAVLGVAARYNPSLTGEAESAKTLMLVSLSRNIETEDETVEAVRLF